MTVAELIARLDGVRERGQSKWTARCPAHEDRAPSLSIRETDDGTILLHDFGGCSALDIVQAIGLEFADLFPARQIRRVDRSEHRLSARDALAALDQECTVVAVIAADMLGSRTIDEQDWRRLATAVARIGSARALCCPESSR